MALSRNIGKFACVKTLTMILHVANPVYNSAFRHIMSYWYFQTMDGRTRALMQRHKHGSGADLAQQIVPVQNTVAQTTDRTP